MKEQQKKNNDLRRKKGRLIIEFQQCKNPKCHQVMIKDGKGTAYCNKKCRLQAQYYNFASRRRIQEEIWNAKDEKEQISMMISKSREILKHLDEEELKNGSIPMGKPDTGSNHNQRITQ